MSLDVLFYHSGMASAPGANLAGAGNLVAVLDACLVNGWGTKGLTNITLSGGVATATVDGANPFAVGDVVEVSGWDQAAYNGRHRITALGASTISWAQSGAPASPGTGAGATVKRPAAGWTRQALATNSAGYRTMLPGSIGRYVQVEDNDPYADSAASARIALAEDLVALDMATCFGERCRHHKQNGWVLVADGRTCYVITGGQHMICFGEITSFVPADGYAVFLNRGHNAPTHYMYGSYWQWSGAGFPSFAADGNGSAPGATLLKGVAQTGGSVTASPSYPQFSTYNSQVQAEYLQVLALPSAADGSVPVCPVLMLEHSPSLLLRGLLRGLYMPFGRFPASAFANGYCALDNVVLGGSLRRLILVRTALGGSVQIALDVGDTWD